MKYAFAYAPIFASAILVSSPVYAEQGKYISDSIQTKLIRGTDGKVDAKIFKVAQDDPYYTCESECDATRDMDIWHNCSQGDYEQRSLCEGQYDNTFNDCRTDCYNQTQPPEPTPADPIPLPPNPNRRTSAE